MGATVPVHGNKVPRCSQTQSTGCIGRAVVAVPLREAGTKLLKVTLESD